MSESGVSAKRGWGSFGAKPAQSETPVRAAAKRRPPGRERSGKRWRSPQFEDEGWLLRVESQPAIRGTIGRAGMGKSIPLRWKVTPRNDH